MGMRDEMRRKAVMADPFLPTGYRLLVQLVDDQTEETARACLLRMFGAAKGSVAKLVAGTIQPLTNGTRWNAEDWVQCDKGFRAYLPVRWE